MEFLTADKGDFTVEIKRSDFIGKLVKVNSEEEAKSFISAVKKEHSLATHNCYAFVTDFGLTSRSSDDGEPSGTAGAPIMEVLKNQKLINTLVVVTRYFGGIKLGAGGLVRAYSRSAAEGVKKGGAKEFFSCQKLKACLSYDEYNLFLREIQPHFYKHLNTDFGEDITVEFCVKKVAYKSFIDKFNGVFYDKTLENIGEDFY